jgi:GNAT superfamily N-acetyltransferase
MNDSQGLQVRSATQSDVDLILALIGELAAYEKLSHEMMGTPDQLREHLFGERRYAEAAIGEIDGKPCGYTLFFHTYSTFLTKPGIWLEDLFVLSDSRGKGLGKALLADLAAKAVERGCGRLEWSVLDWNAPSIAFYKGLGARPVEGWTNYRMTDAALEQLAASSPSRA